MAIGKQGSGMGHLGSLGGPRTSVLGPLLDSLSVPAAVAYSTRKLRAAYAGPAIKVRRSSDSALQDIGFVGNNLDTVALATFVGANSGFIDTWYDQSGNGINAIQGVAGNQPRIVNAGLLDTINNTKPAIRFGISATSNLRFTAGVSQPNTIALVAKDNSHVTNGHYTDGQAGSPRQLIGELSGAYAMYAGAAAPTGGTPDLLAHSIMAFFTGAVDVLTVDGTTTINAAAGTDGVGAQEIGAGNGGTTDTAMDGWLPEYLVFPVVLTASDQARIKASQTSFFFSPVTQWTPGLRPFAASSPINTPIPTNAILAPMNWPAATGSNYYANVKFFFDVPAASAPIVAVNSVAPGWGNPAGIFNRKMTSGLTFTGSDTDNECVSIIGNNCLSIWLFTRNTDTTGVCQAYADCDLILDSGFGPSSQPYGSIGSGVYATGQSCMAGALLKEEFTAGEINHAIALCLLSSLNNGGNTPTWYPPAVGGDGSSGNGLCNEGQILAIPKTTAMPAGLSAFGPKIFRALQNYGAINCDNGGATQFYLGENYNNPGAATWTNPDVFTGATCLVTDANILFPLLQKVGYPLDGIYNVILFIEACAPQLQSVRYAGKLLHITRDSDSTGTDIGNLGAPQGLLDTATLASFCSGTVGRVSTYYAQLFSTYNFTSAGANAPIIYQSGALKTINGKPALAFDGSTNYLKATGSSAQYPNSGAVGMFLNAVVQISDYAANYGIFGSNSAGGLELRIDQTTGFVRLLKNGGATIAVASTAVALNAPTVISARYNADGSYEISLNGVVVVSGTAALVAVTAGDLQVGAGGPGGTELFKGLIGSWLFCSQSNIGTNIKYGIEQYQRQFWGTA